MKNCYLLFLLLPFYSSAQFSKTIEPLFDSNRIKEHVLMLSSDSFQGRKPFTQGETRTLDYLQQQLTKMGMAPAIGNSFLQEVPIALIQAKAAPLMNVNGNFGSFDWQSGVHYAISATGKTSEQVLDQAEVVFAGYGIVAPRFGRNDYKNMDVKGKVVLVLMNDSRQEGSMFGQGIPLTYHETATSKLEEAFRRGAKACFLIQPEKAETSIRDIQLALNQEKWEIAEKLIPSINGCISRSSFLQLLNTVKADAYMMDDAEENSFQPVVLPIRFSTSVQTNITYKSSWNVIAKITGSHKPDECMIYSSHWDHLGTGKADSKGDTIYNGASDNAVGVAVLMELAQAFQKSKEKPERSVIFLFTTAEEMGQLGSLWYSSHPVLPLVKTVANINIDGFSHYGITKDMVTVGPGRSELENYFLEELRKTARYRSAESEAIHEDYFSSDQLNFARSGVPSIFLARGTDYVEGGKEYEKIIRAKSDAHHKASDAYNPFWKFDGTTVDLTIYYHVGMKLSKLNVWPKWYRLAEFRR